jgi:hypothetical protein
VSWPANKNVKILSLISVSLAKWPWNERQWWGNMHHIEQRDVAKECVTRVCHVLCSSSSLLLSQRVRWLTWEVTYLVLDHINNYKYIFVKVTLERYKPRIPRVEVKPHRWREEAIPQSTQVEKCFWSVSWALLQLLCSFIRQIERWYKALPHFLYNKSKDETWANPS